MAILHRRSFLKASGVAIGLPWLESSAHPSVIRRDSARRRLVAINVGLGLHGPNIVPVDEGFNYELPPYLAELRDLRNHFTFLSNTSHPDVGGGHQSSKSFLTAAKHPNSAGFKNSISLDQLAAEQLGTQTRFRSLSLSTSGPGLSWSRSGVELPTEVRPSRVFAQLFLDGKPSEKAAQVQRLRDGQSVLDTILEQSRQVGRELSVQDQKKLSQYFDTVRDAETRLHEAEQWQHEPKPIVDAKPPQDELDRTKIVECLDLMYSMMHLALETDSTRFITLFDTGMNAVPSIEGVDTDYHMLSHHGKDESKIAQLTIVETEIVRALGRFLEKLATSTDGESTLLDKTMVLFGSNLGNASSHDTRNMPMLLAGGGFRHGQHLSFDAEQNYPLPKLYVSMLQRLGMEIDTFGSCTGTLDGLEPTLD